MTSDSEKEFKANIQKEVTKRIKTESKKLDELKVEHEELIRAIEGYGNFLNELDSFFSESCEDFDITTEEMPGYFKSNINEVYQNYSQIRTDAIDEVNVLQKYIESNKKGLNETKRSQRFFRSQYLDSDSFNECYPLVEVYDEEIKIYEENEKNTMEIISKLEELIDKLKDWK